MLRRSCALMTLKRSLNTYALDDLRGPFPAPNTEEGEAAHVGPRTAQKMGGRGQGFL